MSTKQIEALKLALEALETGTNHGVAIDALRRALEQPAQEQPVAWKPIEMAPRDNKRLLYLARFGEDGELAELDFAGTWEYWQESWELSHINGYCWISASGIEEPTHWAYQDEPLPYTRPQPADEPVAWMDRDGDLYATEPDKNWCPPHYPLYTRPQPAAPAIPEDVRDAAKRLHENEYRGPLAWAKNVIDWVAAAPEQKGGAT